MQVPIWTIRINPMSNIGSLI